MVNGRVVDVGERSRVQGCEVRALAAVDVDDELWQVVADPGARYHEGDRRCVAVHDERVHESTAVQLTSNPFRPTRFFTVPHRSGPVEPRRTGALQRDVRSADPVEEFKESR